MSVARVEELLRTRIGLDPTSAGPGLVGRAVLRRITLLGLPDGRIDLYTRRLEASEEELQELVEEVVVPESWFFRDVLPFRLLVERARGVAATGSDRRELRVLSMPCARGEEAYSALLALIDAGHAPGRLRVDAVDLSRRALAAARRGVFSENAFRTSDLSFRDRHFRPCPGGYALDPDLARLVRFRHANLLDPGLLAGEPPYDVVFCRNLLIYFVPEARRRLLDNVDRLLARDGMLVIGHAERAGLLGTRFRPVGPSGSFAFERDTPAPAALPFPPSRPALPAPRLAAPRTTVNPREKPVPSASPSTPAGEPERPGRGRLVEAARLADMGRHDEADRLCEQDLVARGPTPDAYFLLGMVRQAAGDRARAQLCFERAVYLDGRHEDALLALALLAQRRGDHGAAANYRRRAGRAFQEKNGS